ncbi:hypothetical protein [Pseudoalteromonas prydzensis]|uniref:hypothetical protein n=1 Tax=Pseudoalteromonas prydzensis TaxID=182141 RepID=UPI0024BCC291|nr:hypothetical protein [Pseudoalteromonas prydzensis]
MSFINKTTAFGTESLFSENGHLIGSSTPSPFNLGTNFFEPNGSFGSRDVQSAFGTSHFDKNGDFKGFSNEDAFGNVHFRDVDGNHSFAQENIMGASIFENGTLVKRIVGDSEDSLELAQNFMSRSLDLGDDLVDFL